MSGGRHQASGPFGLFTGLFGGLALFDVLGGAFLIGAVLDFFVHPWFWIKTFGPSAVLLIVAFALRNRR
jgi:hypothetical protein